MDATHLDKRVLRWGNSYGIRLTAGDLEAFGLAVDDDVEVGLRPRPKKIDWARIADVPWGPNASQEVDEVLYAGYLEDDRRAAKRRRR